MDDAEARNALFNVVTTADLSSPKMMSIPPKPAALPIDATAALSPPAPEPSTSTATPTSVPLPPATSTGTPPPVEGVYPDPAKEYGGPNGPEPTRYGDWERKGIAVDF